ncbi:MAG TPA: hypothetical protein VHK24_06675 [Steroidobacter sp.]|nr:hypothetical protein [Steroidobacter sp.]
MKKTWPVQDAKARFSEFLKASLTEGPASRDVAWGRDSGSSPHERVA